MEKEITSDEASSALCLSGCIVTHSLSILAIDYISEEEKRNNL